MGMLLEGSSFQAGVARGMARCGVVPAFVALLSSDRTGALRFVMPHGRSLGEVGLALAETEGHG
jgi:hypothetical protein